MRSRVRIRAVPDGRGGTRLVEMRSEAPFAARLAAGEVWLVGAAQQPMGDDDLRIEIVVDDGARLTVRSRAAAIALPGLRAARWSAAVVTARVGADAELAWWPEPTVLTRRSRHRAVAELDVAPSGRLRWREEIVLGRVGETAGEAELSWHLDVGDAPVLHQTVPVGAERAGIGGPAGTAGARALGQLLLVDPAWWDAPPHPARIGRLEGPAAGAGDRGGPMGAHQPLEGPAMLITALAGDARALRRTLDLAVADVVGAPSSSAAG